MLVYPFKIHFTIKGNEIMKRNFKVVLFSPDIPGNTGTIGRTCVALGLQLILIKPYGFSLDEKQLRRAGLDYWKYVDLKEYDSWDDFVAGENPRDDQLFFLTTKTDKVYFDAPYPSDAYLVFGKETKGLPDSIHQRYQDRMYTMPMGSEHIRSLNLANAATAVIYEALRVIEFKP